MYLAKASALESTRRRRYRFFFPDASFRLSARPSPLSTPEEEAFRATRYVTALFVALPPPLPLPRPIRGIPARARRDSLVNFFNPLRRSSCRAVFSPRHRDATAAAAAAAAADAADGNVRVRLKCKLARGPRGL